MKVKKEFDLQNDVESYILYKVSNYHYILLINTKEKYYENYSSISGRNENWEFFVGVTLGEDYSEDGYSNFELHLIDKDMQNFVLTACIPCKHEYHCHFLHYDIAFANSKLKIITEGE